METEPREEAKVGHAARESTWIEPTLPLTNPVRPVVLYVLYSMQQ